MKGSQRMTRHMYRSRYNERWFRRTVRVPGNTAYGRALLLCCGAACRFEFCFVFALFATSLLLLFIPSLLSGPFSPFVFLVMSSVEGGRRKGRCCSPPVFTLVFLSFFACLFFLFLCSYAVQLGDSAGHSSHRQSCCVRRQLGNRPIWRKRHLARLTSS